MHTPRHFRPDSVAREAALIRENPFAIVTSSVSGVPTATHLPMLRAPGPDGAPPDDAPLLGSRMIGHMARVNPHGQALNDHPDVLAIFTGPDSYISPTVYGVTPAAPTWNYAAVHITGTARIIEDPAEALAVIMATIQVTEASAAPPWDPADSADYIRKILAGIRAFEVTVTEVDSTFKLSQDKPEPIQRRVRDDLATSPRGRDRELADLMSNVLGI